MRMNMHTIDIPSPDAPITTLPSKRDIAEELATLPLNTRAIYYTHRFAAPPLDNPKHTEATAKTPPLPKAREVNPLLNQVCCYLAAHSPLSLNPQALFDCYGQYATQHLKVTPIKALRAPYQLTQKRTANEIQYIVTRVTSLPAPNHPHLIYFQQIERWLSHATRAQHAPSKKTTENSLARRATASINPDIPIL